MYTYTWYQWLAFFYLYCFFGWIFESTYVSLRRKHFVNRGFLRLPMLPLYGSGAVMMLWVSLPVRDNLFLVYCSGVVAATALEYVTGYMMERLFKVKYWDYSNQKFQLHGYICLSSSIAWGGLTILMTEVIHQPIAQIVLAIRPAVLIPSLMIISVLFLLDAYESTKEALALGKALEAMTKIKLEMEELQERIVALREEAASRASLAHDEAVSRMEKAAERAALARDEAIGRMEEAVERAASARDEAIGRVEEAVERAASARNEAIGRMEEAVERAASARDEAVNQVEEAVSRAARLREEMSRNAALAKEEAAERAARLREEVSRSTALARKEAEQYFQSVKEKTEGHIKESAEERLSRLTERMEKLRSARSALHPRTGLRRFYRRELFRGNPTAVSRRFADAFRELKEMAEEEEHQD